ncbi:TetR/AcrR family transcriptional regulator [Lentzea sp. NBRC 102530]|uniref:TetR/AcrR family transcriptional regulator n=1 Tax=Lentzea sp. NBRC 102530 TaxID=3032201 RepID=UPI0024A5DDFF|nr:TetR/AcrR family transcriptional regulator [Lentzea sp. NBRC 102530]GLY51222.1 TetR family transcriptional regulator [Lentzea sp. NBRC 102530]
MDTRERLVKAAADLLIEGGKEAVSTRAVAAAAGVQAPTLYRLFGDKDGLLDAVAGYGFADYLASKHAMGATDDPVGDLKRGMELHIGFGLAMPAFYLLMYGEPRKRAARLEADAMLREIISRIASAGRLAVPVEQAAQFVHAAGMGVVLALIATPEDERDLSLIPFTQEKVIAAITTDAAPEESTDIPSRAIALRTAMQEDPPLMLSPAERVLLAEWLDRVAK